MAGAGRWMRSDCRAANPTHADCRAPGSSGVHACRSPPNFTGSIGRRAQFLGFTPAGHQQGGQSASAASWLSWQIKRSINPEAVPNSPARRSTASTTPCSRSMVYQTLLKEQRRLIHAGVAHWLAQAAQSSERVEEFAALIARHYFTGAGEDRGGRLEHPGRQAGGLPGRISGSAPLLRPGAGAVTARRPG